MASRRTGEEKKDKPAPGSSFSFFTPKTGSHLFFRPLIPLTLAFIPGICAAGTGLVSPPWAVGCALAGLAGLVWALCRKKSGVAGPVLLFFGLGCLSIQPWVFPRFPDNHVIHLANGEHHLVRGRVKRKQRAFNGLVRLKVAVESVEDDGSARPAVGNVRLSYHESVEKIQKGDLISFSGRIRRIQNFSNPGGFDYRAFMGERDLYVSAWTREDRVRRLAPSSNPLDPVLADFRKTIRHTIDTAAGTGPDATIRAAVMTALGLGDRSGVGPDLRDAFFRAGVGHLLAISGLHVGSVAAVFFFLFSLAGKRVKFLLLRGRVKPLAALLCFFPVLFYGLVAGGSPSTFRALIMVSVFLLSFMMDRQADLLNTLAAAALAILVVGPPALFMVSFQFSFGAMIFLICSMPYWKKRDPKTGAAGRAGVYASRLVVGSVFIFLGLLPLEMFYFNRITWAGLVMNPVLIPVFSMVIVPLCLMGVFFQMVWAPLAGACFYLAGLALKPCLALIQWMSHQAFACGNTVTPSLAWMVSFYALVWIVLHLARLYTSENKDKPPVFTRRAAAGCCLAIFSVCTFQTMKWAHDRLWDDRLKVTVLDVGKGSAALVELPGGVNFLVDGGGFSSNAIFDTGKYIVAPFLWEKGIRTIHYLVLSHPDTDHMNGLIYVARHFNCQELWVNGETSHTKGFGDLMQAAGENGITVVPKSGDFNRFFWEKAVISVLHPVVKGPDPKPPYSESNNNSLVLRVQYGDFSVLLPGDLMADGEKDLLLRAKSRLKSTVLVAGHHGSRTSTTPAFLRAVSPKAAVISCRRIGGAEYPHPRVIARLDKSGIPVFRTDRDGAVAMVTGGGPVDVTTFRTRQNQRIPP